MTPRRMPAAVLKMLLLVLAAGAGTAAQTGGRSWGASDLPLRQARLAPPPSFRQRGGETEGPRGSVGPPVPFTLRDASRDDRWLGLGVTEVRWAPDGSAFYFRWNLDPKPGDLPEADPWFRVSRDGRRVEQLAAGDTSRIPAARVEWSRDGRRAAWTTEGRIAVSDASADEASSIREIYGAERPARNLRMQPDGKAVSFMLGEDLHEYVFPDGGLRQVTRKITPPTDKTAAARWLEEQQLDLFERHREASTRREAASRLRAADARLPQALPIPSGTTLEDIRVSPDGQWVTFRTRKEERRRPATTYLDYATSSGYAEPREARPKVGELQDEHRFGIVRLDPTVDAEKIAVTWVSPAEAEKHAVIIHGPYWSLDGRDAVVQVVSKEHKDRWISRLDVATGKTTVVAHDHDDAWLGGPPPVAGNLQPALLEWLPDGRFVFASERTGWSHLYLAAPDGTITPLTSGEWEVRDAALSRDRTTWLIVASREHPCDDDLYLMPAGGGDLRRVTREEGRSAGFLSPDGARLAIVHSRTDRLPDLYVSNANDEGSLPVRITESGTDEYLVHRVLRPEVVSFPHPADDKPVWAALFKPAKPNRAALIHVHGGGYRQFSHRGWSVYGYANHLGLIHYMVGQGYTVLDFDYRGSSGFGRDYRTDIYRSMGEKDVLGAVAAVEYLASRHGVDRNRVGVYGVSYGGFFTLMALFRHPGVFAAGIANAAVSDWAHYNHGWTSRILNVPTTDAEAYRASSPIYFSAGLRDPLLIVHGLNDDNVHFQDAARVVQRLIEQEKAFEVMYYPMERHTIGSESSRYDYVRRAAAFFDRHLLGPAAGRRTTAR